MGFSYIHRNPIRAKMVADIKDYFWSSHYFYINSNNETIHTSFILNLISNKKAKAVLDYMNYMETQGNDNDKKEDYKILYNFFDENFKNTDLSIQNNCRKNNREDLEIIASKIFIENQTKNLIISGSKQRHLTPLKVKFIQEARTLKYSVHEIASYLNCGESTISCLVGRDKKAYF
jgi:hypothetical protein